MGESLSEASEAALAEVVADSKPTIVEWRGLTFEVPPPHRWVFRYQLAVRRDDLAGMVEAIIGPEQTDVLAASDNTDADDIADLMKALVDAQGEPPAS